MEGKSWDKRVLPRSKANKARKSIDWKSNQKACLTVQVFRVWVRVRVRAGVGRVSCNLRAYPYPYQ